MTEEVRAGTTEAQRVLAFRRAVNAAAADEVIDLGFGRAYLNRTYPMSWAHNFVEVAADARPGAGGVIRVADEVLAAGGVRHRLVEVEDHDLGRSYVEEFEAAGYEPEPTLLMVHGRAPDRIPPRAPARALTDDEYGEIRRRVLSRSPDGYDAETIRQLADRIELTARAVTVRHFGCEVDGEIASVCDLYTTGGIAQVEDVDTLEEHRGGGLARAMVWLAVDTARREGHDLVFLFADANDWPKELYRKLGFDGLQTSYYFVKKPS